MVQKNIIFFTTTLFFATNVIAPFSDRPMMLVIIFLMSLLFKVLLKLDTLHYILNVSVSIALLETLTRIADMNSKTELVLTSNLIVFSIFLFYIMKKLILSEDK